MDFSWLKSRTTLIVFAVVAIAAMAAWTPSVRQNITPTSVREVTRLNDALLDGTLKVPRGGIVLDDGTFLASVDAIGRRGDVLIRDRSGEYQIVWLQNEDRYVIDIQNENYEAMKAKGEQEFLEVVAGGSIEEACKRNVVVSVVPWITPHPDVLPEYCIS